MFSEFDRLAMTRALTHAARGLYTTNPNPRVGCVIARDERIISEGWHERAGGPHAEIVALRAATEPVQGTTVYVTLEPCSHHGRTPPCVNALIEARVGRVIFAVQDPNPKVSGQGADALSRAGIGVESGLMESEASELNVGFMKRMRTGMPWVRIKLAMSLDGRTALADGTSQWITGEAARADVQCWRARSSAIMTGVGTALGDDPRLNVRLPDFNGPQPLRVVLDSRLRTPPESKMFADGRAGGDVLLFSEAGAEARDGLDSRRTALIERGARIEEVRARDGYLDLPAVARRLGELEANEVLVEAGPTLAGHLLADKLADELLLYVAPKLLGPRGRPLLDVPEPRSLQEALGFTSLEAQRVGDDLRMLLRPK